MLGTGAGESRAAAAMVAAVVAVALLGVLIVGSAIASRSGGGDDGIDVPLVEASVVIARPSSAPFADPPPAIDRLEDVDSRVVRVELAEDSVTLHQCAATAADAAGCARGVVVDADNVVVPLERVVSARNSTVDCAVVACVLAAASEGEIVVTVPLVFGAEAADPSVIAVARGPFERGDTVLVQLAGFPDGSQGAVTVCEETSRHRPARCRREGAVPFETNTFGVATVEIAAACDRSHRCAIGVIDSPVVAPYAVLSFAEPTGASVPGGRVALGLTLCAALLAAAVLLVRRADWTPPGGDPFANVELGPDPFAGIDLNVDE